LVLTPPLGGVFIWGIYGRTSFNFILDSVGGHMGRITSFSKQVIVFFLVTALIIRPTFAANVGGWTLGNPIAQGASAIVNGTKTAVINGANLIKNSTAKITPPASSVAKVLARGVAGYALSVAVEQLLGSVDWVLDPANNQIKYNVAVEGSGLYICSYGGVRNSSFMNCASVWESFNKPIKLSGCSELKQTCTATRPSDGYKYTVRPIVSAEVAPKNEERTYPLGPLAQQVINNAAGGDASAQQAFVAAAQDIINEAETDQTKARPIVNQLEANAKTQTDESATAQAKPQADPVTGQQAPPIDITLEFPKFCTWAPTICEAAQVVLTFPNTLTEWWETAKSKAEEWALSISEAWAKVKEEYYDQPEENTDTELEIPDLEQDIEVDTDISFGGSCPAPLSSDINFMGLNKTIEFSFDPVCQIAEFIKPVVISISAFSAALIVAGIRTEDD
jgi:hypothetical protein